MSATATFIDCCTVSVAAAPRRSCTLIRSWARQLTSDPADGRARAAGRPRRPASPGRRRAAAGRPRPARRRPPRPAWSAGRCRCSRSSQSCGSRSSWSPSSPRNARSSGEGRGVTPPSGRRTPWTETAGSPLGQGGPVGVDPVGERAGQHLRRVVDQPPAGPAGGRRRGGADGDVDRLGPRLRVRAAPAGRRRTRLPAGWLPRARRLRALPLARAVVLELVAGRRAGAQGDHQTRSARGSPAPPSPAIPASRPWSRVDSSAPVAAAGKCRGQGERYGARRRRRAGPDTPRTAPSPDRCDGLDGGR